MNYRIILLIIVIFIILYIIFIDNKQYESFVPMGADGRFLSGYNQISTGEQNDISTINKDIIVEEMRCCPKYPTCECQQKQPKKQCDTQEEIQYSNSPTTCQPPPKKCETQEEIKQTNPSSGCCPKPKVIVKKTIECPPCVCKSVDLSRYVLKSSIPPCPSLPNMSQYILKTEIPHCPDMSKYVLKSSIPPCPQCSSCPPCPDCNCNNNNCPAPKLKCTQVLEENNDNNKYYLSEETQEIIEEKINNFKDTSDNEQCNKQNSSVPKPYDEYMLDDGLQNSYTFS